MSALRISDEQYTRIASLYAQYSEHFKPLLATVEAQLQQLPDSILNEIRSFTDHVSRCYWPNVPAEFIDENIDRAHGHMRRAICDCMKHLILHLHEEGSLSRFAGKADVTLIDNGQFTGEYFHLRQEAIDATRDAKVQETKMAYDEAFRAFENALSAHYRVSKYIQDNSSKIEWARALYTKRRVCKAVLWIVTAIASGFISNYIRLFFFT